MSKLLKAVSIILALIMTLTIVACTQNKQETSTRSDATETTSEGTTITDGSVKDTTEVTDVTETTTKETTGKTTTSYETTKQTTVVTGEETSSEDVTTSGEETTGKEPVVFVGAYDPVSEKVGSYVTLEYNPMYCSVKSEVKKGLGSRETVTLTVTMKDGYIFDGWSTYDYIVNATEKTQSNIKVTTTETYSFDTNAAIEIFVNYSMKVVYDANGGKTKDGKTTLDTTFSVSEFKCPSTLPDQGQFVRDGYVLSEYNTKADGTGTAVSLGSKIRSDSSTLTLYCIWLKETPASDFSYLNSGGEISIMGYYGSSKDVVVPEKINGMEVTGIEQNAFTSAVIETVFLPKTIQIVYDSAFNGCTNLTTIVLFDSIDSISDRAFSGCKNMTNVRINAAMDMYYVGWISSTYCKTDRLIWAADMQKFIIYGGSGTINGIDSTQINDAIGEDYVVINMGANANSSSAFVFEGMKKWLIDGDIILWDPEPGNNTLGDNTIGHRCIPFYVMGNYDFLKGIDISKHKGFFGYLMNAIQEKKNGSVCSFEMGNKTINCYGDATGKRVTQGKSFQYRFDYFTSRNDYSRMTYIINELKKDGVQVWFSYAVMDENLKLNEWAHQGQTIEGVAEQYTADILKNFDVTIISDFFDCTVPNEYFYDSEWHLTNEGAVLRTSKLLVDILAQFEKIGKKY